MIYMMLINISLKQDAKRATTVALVMMFAMSTIVTSGKGSPFIQLEESVEPFNENSKNSTSVSDARDTLWVQSTKNKSILKLVSRKEDTRQQSLEDSIDYSMENESKIEMKNKKLWKQHNDKAIGSKELGSQDNEDGQVEDQYYDNDRAIK